MARTFFMSRYENAVLALLRVATGLFLMQHGVQKMFGWLLPPDRPASPFELVSQRGLAGILEVFGAALFVLGLFTRPIAFLLSGMLAVAYFQSHAPDAFWPILNRGELAALFCFVFFYFSARGGGTYSVDHLLESRRSRDKLDFKR